VADKPKANSAGGQHLEGLASEYGADPNVLAKRLAEGLARDIETGVLTLEELPDKQSEEARNLQQALRSNLVQKLQNEPRIHESLRAADIDTWHFDHARHGVFQCGNVALKAQRNRGPLKAHEVHLIKHQDWRYFSERPELGIKLARIYNPLVPEEKGYVTLDDVLAGEKQVTIFPQAQEYIHGNNLGEIFQLLPANLDPEQRKRVKGVIRKLFRDLETWQQHARYSKELTERIGPRLALDVDAINKYKIETLERCVRAARELTGVLGPEDEKAIKEIGRVIYRLLPTEKRWFKRKLDITPWNTMLRHDLGELTEQNILGIFEYMSPKNVVHVDTGVAYDHMAEEVHNIGDSATFSKVKLSTGGGKEIFGPGNSTNLHTYISNRGYSVPLFDDLLYAVLRLTRVRFHTTTRFLPRHIALRGTGPEGMKGIESYRGAIHYRDQEAAYQLKHLAAMSSERGDAEAEQAFQRLGDMTQRMSEFKMSTYLERAVKK
jgi:hypothetical protein